VLPNASGARCVDCANGGVITNIDASVPMRQLQFASAWSSHSLEQLVGLPIRVSAALYPAYNLFQHFNTVADDNVFQHSPAPRSDLFAYDDDHIAVSP
jgi:hypothetical protein